jgi:cytochrome P450
MPDFEAVDFLTDESVVDDPYPYYEHLRRCPVRHVAPHDIVAVTGYDEVVKVWRDDETFSSCNSFGGPFPGFPETVEGDDIGELIERYREIWPISEHMVTFDPPLHTQHRALLMRLLTPKRLGENEGFMWGLADRLIDEFRRSGRCNFIEDYAHPFALLSIANLLGVPESDHRLFRDELEAHQAGALGEHAKGNPLAFMDELFARYIEDRRRSPRQDVMTKLALATFPDGSLPEVLDIVRIAVFLFAAGQGTTAHSMGFMLQRLAASPGLQVALRDDPSLIPAFIEEALRLESPVKANFRMVRTTTELGGVRVAAGSTVMVMPGAANRDERRFDAPDDFRLDRQNAREHIAFGRGIHACPGGALARTEARISIERLLNRLGDIRMAENNNGPLDRPFNYESSFMLRGLSALRLEFTALD